MFDIIVRGVMTVILIIMACGVYVTVKLLREEKKRRKCLKIF